ncbi:MAG: hypothetical protein N4A57_02730 [Anaeromicrobium sp.]|jgi:hypothetical protein|uniref:hypothetical protein n=1 Tax=Anaeromicrobium sp. TaxID=1929132 RepID=UPI0025D1F876|nr:hypothetical protein [Anaeromicrobium sp.]MCT4593176.1 hypothetical protein [Anaeromicrobium sp.]
MGNSIEILKFNLQERQYPYFTEAELQMLLENNDNDMKKASYQGCIMKAQADDGVNIGPIKTQSNREYWLSLAENFKPPKVYNYNTSMRRADGQ